MFLAFIAILLNLNIFTFNRMFASDDIQGGSKLNTPPENMQYLHNPWSDLKSS